MGRTWLILYLLDNTPNALAPHLSGQIGLTTVDYGLVKIVDVMARLYLSRWLR